MEPASTPTTTLTEDVHQAALKDLPALVGEGRIHWGDDQRARHGADETEDLVFMPDVVMEPESTAEVSAILAWAHAHAADHAAIFEAGSEVSATADEDGRVEEARVRSLCRRIVEHAVNYDAKYAGHLTPKRKRAVEA